LDCDSNWKHDTDISPLDVRSQQALRLKRFSMALGTYVVVILAFVLAQRLGWGHLRAPQWVLMIGSALVGNCIFFLMFVTGMNLHFSDPSLTWLQIAYSSLWGAVPCFALTEVQMRPVFLMFFIPAFSFGILRLNRRQYLGLVAFVMGVYGGMLLLNHARSPAAFQTSYELSVYIIFGIILIWFAFFGGFISGMRQRLREQNAAIRKANREIRKEIEERRQAQVEKDQLIIELQQALSKVKALGGLLPICASCKKIRDDKGYWNQLESYIASRSEAEFSHSICPDCARKLYSGIPGYRNGRDNE
jgi:hypothetical protein